MPADTGRYLRTVRHLKARQLAARLTRPVRLQLHHIASRFEGRRVPFPGLRWPEAPSFLAPVLDTEARPDALGGTFSFVNLPADLGWPPDWRAAHMPALWQYHLHYFDLLWKLSPSEARLLARDWIRTTPARTGTGADPYPTSLRLMNWAMVFFGRDRQRTLSDDTFREELWTSMRRQVGRLRALLEWHLMGNHLLENAAALAMLGSCFAGKEARGWRQQGLSLLRRELREQVLGDGVHMERSPMYQCRVAQLLLNLHATADSEVRTCLAPYLEPLLAATAHLSHPDGDIALLNDSATGVYPAPSVLLEHAGLSSPPAGPFSLAPSGYYGHASTDGSYVICDAGEIGPDYFPAHAHADTLSFEWTIRRRRFITDSGVFDYDPSQMRRYCRSTAAHNTVTIDGTDQSEMWAAFRVGRRARPRGVTWTPRPDGFHLAARHDGYRHLGANHHRTFTYRPGHLSVRDRIDSRREVEAVSRFHLAPGAEVERTGDASVRVGVEDLSVDVAFSGAGRLEVARSWYCDAFYRRRARPVLCWIMAGSRCESEARFTLQGA